MFYVCKVLKFSKLGLMTNSSLKKNLHLSRFLPLFVPCFRPHYVGTSHQSSAIPALAGVISQRLPACAPNVSGVCHSLPHAAEVCPRTTFNGVAKQHSITTASAGTATGVTTTPSHCSHSSRITKF